MNQNFNKSLSNESVLPDPWTTSTPEPHFPSPLELDRLLREPHPLIRAATPYAAICPAGVPGALSLPTHAQSDVSSSGVLLQNELKLSILPERLQNQIEQALALLYWAVTMPEHPA